jgi:DNA-binding beta-propeller fold protein YncE
MKKFLVIVSVVFSMVVLCITSCVHKPQIQVIPVDGNYPSAVAKIIINKCTYSGCHNQASYQNAAGILLDTWEHMFNGGISGAQVVAYSTKFSPLLYYCNVDPSLGIVAKDPGHLDTSLSHDEYMTLYNWVAAGAPDKNGNIPFAANAATRQKIYLTNQGCDVVAVIDAQSRLVMRYIPIGMNASQIESPHDIEISGDGMYAYVPLFNGDYVQKISTLTDTVVGNVNVASVSQGHTGGAWSIISLSPDDTSLLVSGWISQGNVVAVNTSTMAITPSISIDQISGGTDDFPYPHGLTSNATYDTFFATLQFGNVVNKYTFNGGYHKKYVSVDGKPAIVSTPTDSATPNPHQIEMSPDHSRYFVSCQSTNEVRVMDAYKDTVIAVIPVGTFPQEIDISPAKNYLFVACMEDAANPQPGRRGSVYVIDMSTYSVVKILYGDFYQPHDVSVDERSGILFIPSRNANPNGPAPHHTSACGGRDGWYTIYDLNTLLPADNKRYEVAVDPYASGIRFK